MKTAQNIYTRLKNGKADKRLEAVDLSESSFIISLLLLQAKTAQNIYTRLKDGKADERLEALKQLSQLAGDNTFALEFITKDGQKIIKQFVVDGKQ